VRRRYIGEKLLYQYNGMEPPPRPFPDEGSGRG
jgi:hypothetical protein